MRVTRPAFHRLRDEERGAVLMIVAICLIVLVGMLVLVVDLGRSVAVKRDMENATSAAALAAAQKCALGPANGGGFAQAQAAATELLTENTTNVGTPALTQFDAPECNSLTSAGLKFVTVGSSINVDYFFAEIFGLTSGTVAAQAVAEWGPLIGVTSPVPIRLPFGLLTPCIAQVPPASGDVCAFGFDSAGNSESSSQWGVLNYPQGWPTDGSAGPVDCHANTGGSKDVYNYIVGAGDPFQANIPEYPGYVYVCAGPGVLGNDIINALEQMIGQYLVFPVMSDTVPPILDPGNEAYPINGFTLLKLLGAWHGKDARANCPSLADAPKGHENDLWCIRTEWGGPDVVGGIPGSGFNYGLQGIRLVG